MFELPEPLHPAVIHFPIVAILFGAFVSLLALRGKTAGPCWISFALLAVGAIGAFVATQTGDDAVMHSGVHDPHIKALMEDHEEWGDTTLWLTIGSAVAALLAAILARPAFQSRMARWMPPAARVLVALLALAAGFSVYQTAKRGGALVYQHGVGIKHQPPSVDATSK
jgi:uncharacterized membrane protein